MKSRALYSVAIFIIAAFLACSRRETTQTETASATTTSSTTTETVATDTTVTATVTDGKEQIREGAKQLGAGVKEEARKAVAATGAALERGGELLQEKAEAGSAAAPADAPSAASASGAAIFSTRCVGCHGADGGGNTAMGRKNNIRDLRSAPVQSVSDAQLASTIANGRAGGLSASAHKRQALTPAQVQDVVAYLRSIRQ